MIPNECVWVLMGFFIIFSNRFLSHSWGFNSICVSGNEKRRGKNLLISCSNSFWSFLILELGWISYNYQFARGSLSPGQIFFWAPVRIYVFQQQLLLNLRQVIGANYLWWKEMRKLKCFAVGDEAAKKPNQREIPVFSWNFYAEINENNIVWNKRKKLMVFFC